MDVRRLNRAISRIQAALTRVEKAAAPARSGESGARDPVLRQRVGEALAELDSVIERLER